MYTRAIPLAEAFDVSAMPHEEALAALLGMVIPKERAFDTTERMSKSFGSLASALRAPATRLRSVEGVCERTALFVKLVHQVYTEVIRERVYKENLSANPDCIRAYCKEIFGCVETDVAKVFYLRKGRLVHEGPVCVGTVGHVAVYSREVIKTALCRDASTIMVAFGRAYGDSHPTENEAEVMIRLGAAAEVVDMSVLPPLIHVNGD